MGKKEGGIVLVGCGSLTLMAHGLQAASILIDDFNTGPGVVSSANPGPINFAAPSAIGGSRTLELLGFPENDDPISQGAVLRVAAPPGAEGHSQNALSQGGRSRTRWNANGGGLGAIDLTDGGVEDTLNFTILSIDQGTVTVTFNIVSDIFGTATVMSLPGTGSVAVPFSSFTGFSPDIFENVDEINMEITAGQGTDMILDQIITSDEEPNVVPIPAASWMGLSLLGAVGITNTLRRHRDS